jgi:regulator of protease activity HflC (stomatin/prohibitin superfamily)
MVWVHFAAPLDLFHVVSAVLILTNKVFYPLVNSVNLTLVYEGQTGLILKFGKYSRSVDPGLTKVNPYVCIPAFY